MGLDEEQLRQMFAGYTCRDGDIVFEHTPAAVVCWDRNATDSHGIETPRPADLNHQWPLRYALPLYGYVMPLLLAVTIVANTLIVVVMSRRHMRTPTNLVLMAMAVSDMLTLLLPAPWLLYLYTFGNLPQAARLHLRVLHARDDDGHACRRCSTRAASG